MRQQARSDGLKYGEGTIRQRGDSFEARWVESTITGRTRRTRSFPTRDAAEDHLREMHRSHRDGRTAPTSDRTVRELIEDYLVRGAPEWRPYTLGQYRRRARAYIYPTLGKLRAETLTTPQVQRWIDGMVKAGLAPATISGIVVIISAAFNEGTKIGIVPRNPVRGTKRPKIQIKEPPTWTATDIAAVMASIDDPLYDALYRIALATAMRPGELRTLRWSDIDLDAKTITVKRTASRDENLRVIVGSTTKGSRARPIQIAETEVNVLRVWKVHQNIQRIAAPRPWDANNYVFTRPDGRHIAEATWNENHRKLCRKAGVPVITLHGLRHTSATVDLAAGANPRTVMERLGHRSIVTTLDRYFHVSPAMHRQAAEELSRRLFGDDERTS